MKKIIIFSHCFRDSIPFMMKENEIIQWKNINHWLEEIIKYLTKNNNFKCDVIIRQHPNSIDKNYENEYLNELKLKYKIKIENNCSVKEILKLNDEIIILTWFGNIFYEGIKNNNKVFYFSGSPYSKYDEENKWKLEIDDDLLKKIENYQRPTEKELLNFSKYYEYYYPTIKNNKINLMKMVNFELQINENSFFENIKKISKFLINKKIIFNELSQIKLNE